MVSFDDEKRSNLEEIKNSQLRAFRDSDDPEFKGGQDKNDSQQPSENKFS